MCLYLKIAHGITPLILMGWSKYIDSYKVLNK